MAGFSDEVAAIRRIVGRNPGVGAFRLARRIKTRDFLFDSRDYEDAGYSGLISRTFLSVYSVVRRHRAGIKATGKLVAA